MQPAERKSETEEDEDEEARFSSGRRASSIIPGIPCTLLVVDDNEGLREEGQAEGERERAKGAQ